MCLAGKSSCVTEIDSDVGHPKNGIILNALKMGMLWNLNIFIHSILGKLIALTEKELSYYQKKKKMLSEMFQN